MKISDFGCSHYSEALQAASAHAEPDGEGYVDDIELAKTAGSPAFFAPEMCFSGLESALSPSNSRSPRGTPMQEIPAFTLRPPSLASESDEYRNGQTDGLTTSSAARTFPLKSTVSNDSGLSKRPLSERTESSATVHRTQRHPITNAIDVWALGVTLYCLLFGKTPFDAPNEYLLLQVIPTADYDIPRQVTSEHLPTSNAPLAVQDCLDLLRRLLEKEPSQRIGLERAKVRYAQSTAAYRSLIRQRHPFTLEGLPDPSEWLARTDPHAQTFVTVSNDEVAAVVIKSSSFREKFRKSIKNISHKLQILGGVRSRSRSIGEPDSAPNTALSGPRSATGSQLNLSPNSRPIPRIPTGSKETSPLTSPSPGNSRSRRFSALAPRPDVPSPRRSSVQLDALQAAAPEMASRSVSSQSSQRGFVVHRPHMLVKPDDSGSSFADTGDRPPARTMASSSSLDKLRSSPDVHPSNNLQRRSSDMAVPTRPRAPSNASSSGGLGHRLMKMISRSGSSRSRPPTFEESDVDEQRALPNRVYSSDAVSVSEGGRRSSDIDSISTGPHGAPVGFERLWQSRLTESRQRRGSTLSEEVVVRVDGPPTRRESHLSDTFHDDVEEVDWIGSTSGDDVSGDEVSENEDRAVVDYRGDPDDSRISFMHGPSVSAAPNLASIPDVPPNDTFEPTSSPGGDADSGRNLEEPEQRSVDDDGLAIDFKKVGSGKRGRKGSTLGTSHRS